MGRILSTLNYSIQVGKAITQNNIQEARAGIPKIGINCLAIDNSGMNVFLISSSVEGASHTYSRLSCLVLVGKSLLCIYGRMASMAYTADSILAIVLSS